LRHNFTLLGVTISPNILQLVCKVYLLIAIPPSSYKFLFRFVLFEEKNIKIRWGKCFEITMVFWVLSK
jgi:hypothetical protein